MKKEKARLRKAAKEAKTEEARLVFARLAEKLEDKVRDRIKDKVNAKGAKIPKEAALAEARLVTARLAEKMEASDDAGGVFHYSQYQMPPYHDDDFFDSQHFSTEVMRVV